MNRSTAEHRYRSRALVVFLAALSFLAIPFACRIQFDFSPEAILIGDETQSYLDDHELLQNENGLIILALEGTKDHEVFSPSALNWQYRVTGRLAEHDRIHRVLGLANIRIPKKFGRSRGRKTLWLFGTGEHDKESASALKDRVLHIDQVRESFVSDDLTCTGILLYLNEQDRKINQIAEVVSEIEKVLAENPCPDGYRVHLSGIPYVRVRIIDLLKADQTFLIPIAGAFLGVVMILLFRCLGSIILPPVALGIGLLWTIAMLAITNQPINILNNVLPIILLVVGASNCVHLLNRYSEEATNASSNREAIRRTMAHMIPACLLTTATTAIGFLSLIFASSKILRAFGWQSAMGLGLVIASILATFIAAGHWFNAPPKTANRRRDISDLTLGITQLAVRYPWRIVSLAMIPICLSIIVSTGWLIFPGIKINSYLAETLANDSPAVQSMKLIESKLGGFLPIEIILSTDSPGELTSVDVMNRLRRIKREFEGLKEVTHIRSLVDLVQLVDNQTLGTYAIEGDQPIEDTDYHVKRVSEIVEGLKRNRSSSGLAELLTKDELQMRMSIQFISVGTRRARQIARDLQTLLQEEFPDDGSVKTQLTGEMYVGMNSLDRFVTELLFSFFFATLLIFLVLTIYFRSLRIGMISILPNITPLLVTLGYMGFRGLDLNVANVTVFAIGLGIAVDDTIHFISRYVDEINQDGNVEEAIKRTARSTGKAIVLTTVLIIGGMLVLTTSNFIPTRQFAELTIVTMCAALLGDLLILPAMIRLVFGLNDAHISNDTAISSEQK